MSDDDVSSPETPGGSAQHLFDLAVFNQGEVWVGADGWEYPLREMSTSERNALRQWLLDEREYFYAHCLRQALMQVALRSRGSAPRWWDHSDPDGSSTGGRLPALVFLSAAEWLESTLLMRELRRFDA